MNIAVGSDMKTGLTDVVVRELEERGYTVDLYGALIKETAQWSAVGIEVAQNVANEKHDQAILFCWTGTGISIAANKVQGVRAALCNDAETARGARLWNDANILAISLRAVSEAVAKEMLDVWFNTEPSTDSEDTDCLAVLRNFEQRM